MSPKWTLGDVEIFQIVELEAGEIIQSVITAATPDNIKRIPWLTPHFADETGRLKALVQSFLIKSDGINILVDTCNGNDKVRTDVPAWSRLHTKFLDNLSAIGVSPSQVNVVACTHLHMDHVGWNTTLANDVWVPTFPNAQYLFARSEYDYWIQKPQKEIADDKAAFDDSVSPIIAAGLAKLVEVNHRINRHVSFMSTPGHTPAHVSVVVESKQHRAIISGDALHHPCQIAMPDWTTESDTFPETAVTTRKALLNEISDRPILLIGSHFANPVAGCVKTSDSSYFLAVDGAL